MLTQKSWTNGAYKVICKAIYNTPVPKIASFDFDNTMIQGDLGYGVLNSIIHNLAITKAQQNVAIAESLKFVQTYSDPLLEKMFSRKNFNFKAIFDFLLDLDLDFSYRWSRFVFAGWTVQQLQDISNQVFYHSKQIHIPQEMLDLIETLIDHNWHIVIVSASPELLFTKQILGHFGLKHQNLTAMKLVVDDRGQIVPKILEPMTSFSGKVHALKKIYNTPPHLAFGDSISDLPMLRYAKQAILISESPQIINHTKNDRHIVVQSPFLPQKLC